MKLFVVLFLALAFNCIHYSSSQGPDAGGADGGASADTPDSGDSGASDPNASGMSEPNVEADVPNGYKVTVSTDEIVMAVKIIEERKSWDDALNACINDAPGAYLAYATSKEEEDMYLQMMIEVKWNDVWIGIRDVSDGKGDYRTVHGDKAEDTAYFTWFPGEPNSNNGPEPCCEYRRARGNQQGLNDRKCSYKTAFMCKVTLPIMSNN